MAVEIMAIRSKWGAFLPATSIDGEKALGIRPGVASKITVTQVSSRSLQHHRLYFGGLLALAMEYWTPTGGCVHNSEKKLIESFVRWIEGRCGADVGSMGVMAQEFLHDISVKRAEKIHETHKSIEQLHEWVKIEAGYFDVYETPAGIKKVARSISFARMSQAEFEEFYRAAFSVIWRFILSRTFIYEHEAEEAVMKLLAMG